MNQKTAHLKVHEWLAVALLIGIIGTLAIISAKGNAHTKPNFTAYNKGVEILVKGAVAYPGMYRLPSEVTMQELLAIVHVQPEADLRRLSMERLVKQGRVVNIPERSMITVHLQGAVKTPGPLRVPKGSRMEELLALPIFSENANTQGLRKKRKLKADEIIDIPNKK